MPHHNLANAVKTKIQKGNRYIKLEGFTKEEKENSMVISRVMEWSGFYDVTDKKCRIGIKMDSDYEVKVYSSSNL